MKKADLPESGSARKGMVKKTTREESICATTLERPAQGNKKKS